MMLAEKVETREQFVAARDLGYVYFQAYFFRRPEVLKTKEIPANRVNYLRMLEAISREELDVRELENLIKTEASVLYRLLRYLNSPMFAFKSERSAHDQRSVPAGPDVDDGCDPGAADGEGAGDDCPRSADENSTARV